MRKKRLILFLNTLESNWVYFALLDEQTHKIVHRKKISIARPQNEKILEYLAAFFKTAEIQPQGLKKIIVTSGSGSFTGLRVGFAHALAFALALSIPVYSVAKNNLPKNLVMLLTQKLKKVSSVRAIGYGAEPKITLRKN